MVSPQRANVFCQTSMWMTLPLVSAFKNGKLFLGVSLMLTLVASMQHWRQIIVCHEAHFMWHNLDRFAVLLVLSQVHMAFWPILLLLFALGARLQRMHVKTCVWNGGAGKVSRNILPFRAQRWHFWCHVLCRYIAFWACCLASGHVTTIPPDDVDGRFWQWVQMFQVIIYSTLYLVHIHVVLHSEI